MPRDFFIDETQMIKGRKVFSFEFLSMCVDSSSARENLQKMLDGAIPIGVICSPKSKDFMCGKIRRFEVIGLLAFGLSIVPLFNGFCQNTNPVLQISKPGSNAPAVVSWNSNTNEIYTLLYSTNLTTGFLPAVMDLPNQGANTVWSDMGIESGLGSWRNWRCF